MKRIGVFFFSGTGMTKYVIEELKNKFENHQICFDCFAIENAEMQEIKLDSYDMVGVAYPVHSFNAPQIVINFVKRLPKIGSMNTFIINTAGEYNALNFASSALLIKMLNKKGYNVFYDKQFIMPCNFIIKKDEATVKHLLCEVDKEIPNTVNEIINDIAFKQTNSLIVRTLAIIGRVEWIGAHIIGKCFYTEKSCNQCGKCAKNCPNHNIKTSNKSVSFKWNCGLCMRCIYQCPQSAINIHIPFKFIRLNSWYELSKITTVRK